MPTFTTVAKETKLPMLLYNIPGRSVINMFPETTIALSKVKNIRAMKEASGNLEQMAEIIEGTDEGFSVYSGDDGLTLPLLAIGGKGIISVASHVVGNEMQKMIAAFYRRANGGGCIDAPCVTSVIPRIVFSTKSCPCEVCTSENRR